MCDEIWGEFCYTLKCFCCSSLLSLRKEAAFSRVNSNPVSEVFEPYSDLVNLSSVRGCYEKTFSRVTSRY